MTRRTIPFLLLFLSFLFGSQTAFAQNTTYPLLHPGRTQRGAVELNEEGFGYATYTVQVSEQVFGLEILLAEAPADLDIYIRHDQEIQEYSNVDVSSTSYAYNERLFVSRLSSPALQDGVYYVDVVYQAGTPAFDTWKRLKRIPFEITATTITSQSTRRIRTDSPVYGELRPEEGMAKTYRVELPEGVERCRVDLFDAQADLDLLIAYERPVPTYQNADYIGDSLVGNESLVLDGSVDEPEIPAGTYYITVFDSVGLQHPQQFGLQVSLDSAPPEPLLSIPRFPRGDDELQQALYSTLEVVGELGRGAGSLVTPDGMLLTNWHVIEGYDGEASEEIILSASLSSQEAPQELFRARLLEYDEELDLALLQIESGLYGQELPDNYEFPYLPLGNAQELQLGQPLSFIGFPGAGEAASRASVTLTRGIVSGFERRGDNQLIKTDASISPGNSGGAAINAYYELVGLVSQTIGTGSGSLGLIIPVSEIPSDWIRSIERRQQGSY